MCGYVTADHWLAVVEIPDGASFVQVMGPAYSSNIYVFNIESSHFLFHYIRH